MKNAIKKTIKFISSRALYFFIGVFLSIAIVTVYAALPTVSPGDPLTAAKWNELVNKVNESGDGLTGAHTICSWTAWSSCVAWAVSTQVICPINTFSAGYQRQGCSAGSCADSTRCEQARIYCCN